VEAYNALASLYVQKRNLEQAEKYYALALQRDSRHAPARHNLALLYLARTQRNKAEDLLAGNTGFPPSRLKLAEILLAKGQADEARRLYEQALTDGPDNIEARTGMSTALQSLGRPKEAVRVLTWPGGDSNPAVQQKLGELYLASGRQTEACEAFRRALRLQKERFSSPLSRTVDEEKLKSKLKTCP
jgi:tetratricopeptide (TPR) repeat protein